MEDYGLPNMIYSSDSDEDEQKEFKIDVDSVFSLLRTKISTLKLNSLPGFFDGLEKEITEQIPIFEEFGIEFNYNDLIEHLIKEYIPKQIFDDDDDNLYRLYMHVFDPNGEEYANIYNIVKEEGRSNRSSIETIIMQSREVKKNYIEYLKRIYSENEELFHTTIGQYFKKIEKTGFDFMPNGSKRRTMKDVATNESQRCPKNSVKIVHGHGNIIHKQAFRIPSGVKVITLSQTNVCIPQLSNLRGIKKLFVPFMKLYMGGNTIFEKDDSVKKLHSNFEPLLDKYKKLGSEYSSIVEDPNNQFNFQYGLHLPGDIIPDMEIQTDGSDCGHSDIGDNDGCNIICFEKGKYGLKRDDNTYLNYIKFVASGHGTIPDGDKSFTKMSNIIEEMGDGTYIIYSCRYTQEPSYTLSRSLSNNVRLPGYQTSPDGLTRPDRSFMLGTRDQPEDIDGKNLYRYHIEFLEDYVDLIKHIEELEKENQKLKQDNEELDEYSKRMYSLNYDLNKDLDKSEIDLIKSQNMLKTQNQGGGRKTRKKSRRKNRKR